MVEEISQSIPSRKTDGVTSMGHCREKKVLQNVNSVSKDTGFQLRTSTHDLHIRELVSELDLLSIGPGIRES